jgi:hypothetical protein
MLFLQMRTAHRGLEISVPSSLALSLSKTVEAAQSL